MTTPVIYAQRQYATLADAIADMGLPAESAASYVMYDEARGGLNANLLYTRTQFGNNGILVLPERPDPYVFDCGQGFRAPGVSSVDGWPVFNSGGAGWFTMLRCSRGIVGLGPGVTIQLTDSTGWSAPQQGEQGVWGYTDTSGAHHAFDDAACSVIEFDNPNAVLANLVLPESLDLGGVAYSFAHVMSEATHRGTLYGRRLTARGSNRGFLGGPNGETGALATKDVALDLEDCYLSGALPDGTRVGTSPLMVSQSHAPNRLVRVTVDSPVDGMMTFFRCSGGETLLEDCTTSGPHKAQSINLESNYNDFSFRAVGGSFAGSPIVVGVGDYSGGLSGVGNMDHVHFYGSAFPATSGELTVQEYANGQIHQQDPTRIAAFSADGVATPTTKYYDGTTGAVTVTGGVTPAPDQTNVGADMPNALDTAIAKYNFKQYLPCQDVPGRVLDGGTVVGNVPAYIRNNVEVVDVDDVSNKGVVWANAAHVTPPPINVGYHWTIDFIYWGGGQSPYVDLTPAGKSGTALTFMTWLQVPINGYGETLLAMNGASGAWRVLLGTSGGTVFVEDSAGSAVVSGTGVTSDHKWHHVAVTINAGTATVYFDGVSVKSGAIKADIGAIQSAYMGMRPPAADGTPYDKGFGFSFSRVICSDTAVDAATVKDIYDSSVAQFYGVLPTRGRDHWALSKSAKLANKGAGRYSNDAVIPIYEHWSEANNKADMTAYIGTGTDGTISTNAKNSGQTLDAWAADAAAAGYDYLTKSGSANEPTTGQIGFTLDDEQEGKWAYLEGLEAQVPRVNGVRRFTFVNYTSEWLRHPLVWSTRAANLADQVGADQYGYGANNDMVSNYKNFLGITPALEVLKSRSVIKMSELIAAKASQTDTAKILHQFLAVGHPFENESGAIVLPNEYRGSVWAVLLAGLNPTLFNKSFTLTNPAAGPYKPYSDTVTYTRLDSVESGDGWKWTCGVPSSTSKQPSIANGWIPWQRDSQPLNDKGKAPNMTQMQRRVRAEIQLVAKLHNKGGLGRCVVDANKELAARYWADAKTLDDTKPGPVMLVMQYVKDAGTYTVTLPPEMAAQAEVRDQDGTLYTVTNGTISLTFANEYEFKLLVSGPASSTKPFSDAFAALPALVDPNPYAKPSVIGVYVPPPTPPQLYVVGASGLVQLI